MLQQKAFRKSNRHSMIWEYNEKEILCTKKHTISHEFSMIGVTKAQLRYSYNQVRRKLARNTADIAVFKSPSLY